MSELPPTPDRPVSERSLPAVLAHQERRQHPRFKAEGATVAIGKGGLLAALGLPRKKDTVTNLSAGGLLVKTSKRYAPGARLHLEIEIHTPPDHVSCAGIVRWSAQSAKDDAHFYAGIQFDGIDELTRKKIAKMGEWFTSAAYRANAAVRREASSAMIKKPKYD